MKITGLDLYGYTLPLTAPLPLGNATLHHREGLLLRLGSDDGSTGWGEVSPLPGFSRESLAQAAGESHRFAASLVGREVNDGWIGPDGRLAHELDRLDPSPSVRFGLETAAWSLLAAARGTTLPEAISPDTRAAVPVNGLLNGTPEQVMDEARWMRDAGYEAVKLKVGIRPVVEDIALVRTAKSALGDGVSLRLDANRAWSFKEGARFARDVSELDIEYIEEPLVDPTDLRRFAEVCGIAVALDESLIHTTPETLREHRYASAVVLKPTLLGGISRTLRLAEQAVELSMRPVISAAYESGVGTAALVALAADIGDVAVPAGLDTYRRLAEDVLEPRLPLPASRVDVREVFKSVVVRHRLQPVRSP